MEFANAVSQIRHRVFEYADLSNAPAGKDDGSYPYEPFKTCVMMHHHERGARTGNIYHL
jgi:hypothetical protein